MSANLVITGEVQSKCLPATAEYAWAGDDGNWVQIPRTGGGGGTSDHSLLLNRNLADQHEIGAITGLSALLDTKANLALLDDYLSKTNIAPYEPTLDYHPATKKYVDDNAGGASSTYTGTPDVTVGGFEAGTTYTGLNMQEFGDQLLAQEFYGTLTAPSNTFANSFSGYREIGIVTDIAFTAGFNRGSINPQYDSADAFRSGLPNTYRYTGADLPASVSSTALSDNPAITGYTVLAGVQTWTCSVSYDEGVQPVGSKGTDFNSPLPAGTTSAKSTTVTGVYPYFATTNTIDIADKQALGSMTATVTTNLVSEDDTNKQIVDFPEAWKSITKLEAKNVLSGNFEEIDLETFTVTSITKDVQGNTVNYNRYTHNGVKTGARELRWS